MLRLALLLLALAACGTPYRPPGLSDPDAGAPIQDSGILNDVQWCIFYIPCPEDPPGCIRILEPPGLTFPDDHTTALRLPCP